MQPISHSGMGRRGDSYLRILDGAKHSLVVEDPKMHQWLSLNRKIMNKKNKQCPSYLQPIWLV